MEWLNFFIIVISNIICLVWSFKKRFEINSTRIVINEDAGFSSEEQQQKYDALFRDREDLQYVADTCNKVIHGILHRYHKYMLIIILVASLMVYVFLEENYTTFS